MGHLEQKSVLAGKLTPQDFSAVLLFINEQFEHFGHLRYVLEAGGWHREGPCERQRRDAGGNRYNKKQNHKEMSFKLKGNTALCFQLSLEKFMVVLKFSKFTTLRKKNLEHKIQGQQQPRLCVCWGGAWISAGWVRSATQAAFRAVGKRSKPFKVTISL